MKKILLSLAIAVSSLTSFTNRPTEVNPEVLNAFQNEFALAKNVEWVASQYYYKAGFEINNKYLFAYYNQSGKLLAITRHIVADELPIKLQLSLKKKYAGFWISDLFEVAKNDSSSYFITLEDADCKLVLQSSDGKWEVYSKSKKV